MGFNLKYLFIELKEVKRKLELLREDDTERLYFESRHTQLENELASHIGSYNDISKSALTYRHNFQ